MTRASDSGRPDDPHPEDAASDEYGPTEAERRQRRQRREAVFGDVLPDGTRDERGDGWSEREPREGSDEWLRRQVPPHHG
jgi:hypothetical protein